MSSKTKDPSLVTFSPPAARRPWAGMLLSVIGLSLVAAGPLAVLGPQHVPQLEQLAELFRVYDLRADVVAACGLVLIGLGRIASYLYSNTNALLQPGYVAHDLEQVDAGLRELQSRMKELRDEQALTRERLAGLSRQIGEHRDVSAQGHENAQNALFRLASSLDQLAANVEHSLQSHVHEVLERVQDCHQLTEASREYVSESLDGMGRELAQYVYDVVTSVSGPRPSMHPTFSDHGHAQRAPQPQGAHGEARGDAHEAPLQTQPESTEPGSIEFDASTYASQAGYSMEYDPGAEEPVARMEPGELPSEPPPEHQLREPLKIGGDDLSRDLSVLDESSNPTPEGAPTGAPAPAEATGEAESPEPRPEEAPAAGSPLGLLDSLDDPTATDDSASRVTPPEPPAALPAEAAREAGQGEGEASSAGSEQHQPLPTVLPPLNPRDPRNLNG